MTEKGMLLTLEYMIAMYESCEGKEKRTVKHIIREFSIYAIPETDIGEEKFYDLLGRADIHP